jgi:SSS family transporter
MTPYDYGVLGVYFVFMLAISWAFRRFVKNVSDYFRSGGQIVWWMVGGSAFMVSFSAWTFTGAASKAYSDGWPIVVIYIANAIGFIFNAVHFAPRFRQLRVITAIQAVRERFGRGNEQIFTWLQLPTGIIYAGIWLNSLGVFFSAAFGIDLTLTIFGTGIVVLLMSLVGGSWAVVASDFIQVLILMPVCLVVAVLAVLKVGGLGAFFERVPAHHFDFSQVFSKEFLMFWCVAILIKQFTSTNNLMDASRYLCVKDSRHARWAGYLGAGLFFIGIFIWFVPPMAAAALFPDLRAVFPNLRNPDEAAFMAISQAVLPVGMLGLLVSGIFAATMSSMDSGLNKNAGIFIKNFYQPILRPHATDKQLLYAGKITTVVLGLLVVLVAWQLSRLRGMSLFDMMVRFGSLVSVPITVPLVWGLIVKRTPPWAAWSTVAVGFASSLICENVLTSRWAAETFFGAGAVLDRSSTEYWGQAIAVAMNITVGSLWFLGCTRFWHHASPEYRATVEEFFRKLNTPVDFHAEGGEDNSARQESLIGRLCLVYGGFVVLLALIPNPLHGRLAFVACGGIVLAIGYALVRRARRALAHAG